jgi:hypothetical protein
LHTAALDGVTVTKGAGVTTTVTDAGALSHPLLTATTVYVPAFDAEAPGMVCAAVLAMMVPDGSRQM